jgi:hypothetical protein
MKKMKQLLFIICILFISCYTIDGVKNANNRNFKKEVLLTLYMIERIYPVVECNPRYRKEHCAGVFRQVCNNNGQWENYEKCTRFCMEYKDQDIVKCNDITEIYMDRY